MDNVEATAGGLSAFSFDEEDELTEIEVDELLAKAQACNEYIASQQARRDAFQNNYRLKIAKAEEIFEADTRYARKQLEEINAILRRYAEKHISGNKRSVKFPSGTLQFTKQQPQFFIDGVAVTNDNPKLVELARSVGTDFVALKETAKWSELKKHFVVGGDTVFWKDTGEVVPELRAYTPPDEFKIKTA